MFGSIEMLNAVEQGWMRALEVADYLGVTQQRVTKLAAGGGLPAPRMMGWQSRAWSSRKTNCRARFDLSGNRAYGE